MPTPDHKLSVISLFTGAGGLDLGFEAAGFTTRVAVELDPDAVATIRHNRDWPLIPHDIHSDAASSERLLKTARLRQGDADVLIGGPPCQPFSKSGYWASGDALRLADPRASTLGAYLRVLRDTLPKAYLLENVPGIAFTAKDEGLAFLRKEIESINRDTGCCYTFRAQLLRAVEFGVPQDRHRVFIIGHRDGKDFVFPEPSHGEIGEGDLLGGPRDRVLTAWDAIGDQEDDDDPCLRVTGKWAKLLPTIPEGFNYLYHTDRGQGLPLFGWRRRYWSFLLKLAKAQPSWTIAAQPGPAIGPFHWRNRRLSVRELCRLQTFPKDYVVLGSLRAAQKQVGNAVPSALAERLALEIRQQLLGDKSARNFQVTLVPKRRCSVPPPDPVTEVPSEYRHLVGTHDAHPGTGKGYRASVRTGASSNTNFG
jgi:DNA (cytosine-5)-methyltransferase 1